MSIERITTGTYRTLKKTDHRSLTDGHYQVFLELMEGELPVGKVTRDEREKSELILPRFTIRDYGDPVLPTGHEVSCAVDKGMRHATCRLLAVL